MTTEEAENIVTDRIHRADDVEHQPIHRYNAASRDLAPALSTTRSNTAKPKQNLDGSLPVDSK